MTGDNGPTVEQLSHSKDTGGIVPLEKVVPPLALFPVRLDHRNVAQVPTNDTA